MDKRRIEFSNFEKFRKCVPDFPEGPWEHTDSPDFLIHTKDGRLGVEHRQLFQPPDPDKQPPQARKSRIDDILARAQEHAEARGIPPVRATFNFNLKEIRLNKAKRLELAKRITDAVAKNLPQKKQRFESCYPHYSQYGIPDEISRIGLSRYDDQTQHEWFSVEAQEVSAWRKALQAAIDEKAQKLQPYRDNKKLYGCWLLIVAASTFEPNQLSESHIYTSPFDRTYFLNESGFSLNYLIQLKTRPSAPVNASTSY